VISNSKGRLKMKKLVMLSLLCLAGCPHAPVSPTTDSVFSCLSPATGDVLDMVKADVLKAISGTEETWVKDLETLAMKDGWDTVVCIVSAMSSQPPPAMPMMVSAIVAPKPPVDTAARAKKFLVDHNIKLVQPGK
jgi:hypothetical protein